MSRIRNTARKKGTTDGPVGGFRVPGHHFQDEGGDGRVQHITRQTCRTEQDFQTDSRQLVSGYVILFLKQGCGSGSRRQKWHTQKEKSKEISCFELLDVLFWRLKASRVAWASLILKRPRAIFDKKNLNFFSFKFFPIFGHDNHESKSESGFRKNAQSASALYQCGSATLKERT